MSENQFLPETMTDGLNAACCVFSILEKSQQRIFAEFRFETGMRIRAFEVIKRKYEKAKDMKINEDRI